MSPPKRTLRYGYLSDVRFFVQETDGEAALLEEAELEMLGLEIRNVVRDRIVENMRALKSRAKLAWSAEAKPSAPGEKK